MKPKSLTVTATLAILAALTAVACATAPPSPPLPAARVTVYDAPLDGSHPMPAGCREIQRTPAQQWSELDRTGPTDPYRAEREATAAAGGNVLLVLNRMTHPRSNFDCPAASPITDCPPSLGAWFDLVFVSYACSVQGLSALPAEHKP